MQQQACVMMQASQPPPDTLGNRVFEKPKEKKEARRPILYCTDSRSSSSTSQCTLFMFPPHLFKSIEELSRFVSAAAAAAPVYFCSLLFLPSVAAKQASSRSLERRWRQRESSGSNEFLAGLVALSHLFRLVYYRLAYV